MKHPAIALLNIFVKVLYDAFIFCFYALSTFPYLIVLSDHAYGSLFEAKGSVADISVGSETELLSEGIISCDPVDSD